MPPVSDAARRRLLAVAAALLAAVLVLWGWLELVGPLPGERAVLAWQDAHPSYAFADGISALLGIFMDVGSPIVAALLVLGLAAAAFEGHGLRGAVLVALAAGVVVATTLLKACFGPTPLWAAAGGHANYPSGHTAFATAVGGLLVLAALAAGRRIAAGVLAAAALAMGPAMVLGGAHLPSDVIAGFAVGLAWLLAVVALATPRGAVR